MSKGVGVIFCLLSIVSALSGKAEAAEIQCAPGLSAQSAANVEFFIKVPTSRGFVYIAVKDPNHLVGNPEKAFAPATTESMVISGMTVLGKLAKDTMKTLVVKISGYDTDYEEPEEIRWVDDRPVAIEFRIDRPTKGPEVTEPWAMKTVGIIKALTVRQFLMNLKGRLQENEQVKSVFQKMKTSNPHYGNWTDAQFMNAIIEIYPLIATWKAKMILYLKSDAVIFTDDGPWSWVELDSIVREGTTDDALIEERMMKPFKDFNFLRLGDRLDLITVLWNSWFPAVDLESFGLLSTD